MPFPNLRHVPDPAADDGDAPTGRRPLTPIGLPSGRAIVGGLLVAVSGLGVFAAHRAVTTPDVTRFLVVGRPVAAGAVLRADDLALAPMTLDSATSPRAVTDPDDVLGRVALVPMEAGDLVLRSTTAQAAPDDRPGRRIGVALDAAAALGGDLEVGDRVDVLSIPGADAASQVVVQGAMVSATGPEVDLDAGGVGGSAPVQLTLDVPDGEAARRLVDAQAHGGITLVTASTVTLDGTGAP